MKNNTNGLLAAKDAIEATQETFFRKVFTHTEGDVSVSMNGRYELKALESPTPLSAEQVLGLHKSMHREVKDNEMRGYCKVRNDIKAKYRIDIAKSIPEVADAVKYMDRKQNAALA